MLEAGLLARTAGLFLQISGMGDVRGNTLTKKK